MLFSVGFSPSVWFYCVEENSPVFTFAGAAFGRRLFFTFLTIE